MRKILLFICLLAVIACKVESPDVAIKDIRFEGMAQGEIKVKILVEITNTNNFGVTLKNIDFKMYYDNTIFGTGTWEGTEYIDSNSSKTIPIKLAADKDILMRVIGAYFLGKSGDVLSKFSIDGKAVLKKFWSSYTHNFKWKYKDKKDQKDKKEHKDKQKDERKEEKDGKDKDKKELKDNLDSDKKLEKDVNIPH